MRGNDESDKSQSTVGRVRNAMVTTMRAAFQIRRHPARQRPTAADLITLTHDDAYTQDGKNRWTEINGARIQNRDVLGRIGNALEQQFGENILAWLATKNLDLSKRYSFGSVRRQQGIVYRAKGGIILGVRRPGVGPSRYEFDRFDESLVDLWIDNDGDLQVLERKVIGALQEINLQRMAV
jgi:hypothetical protein